MERPELTLFGEALPARAQGVQDDRVVWQRVVTLCFRVQGGASATSPEQFRFKTSNADPRPTSFTDESPNSEQITRHYESNTTRSRPTVQPWSVPA